MYWTQSDAEEFQRDWMRETYPRLPGIWNNQPTRIEWLAIVVAAYEEGREDEHRDPKH